MNHSILQNNANDRLNTLLSWDFWNRLLSFCYFATDLIKYILYLLKSRMKVFIFPHSIWGKEMFYLRLEFQPGAATYPALIQAQAEGQSCSCHQPLARAGAGAQAVTTATTQLGPAWLKMTCVPVRKIHGRGKWSICGEKALVGAATWEENGRVSDGGVGKGCLPPVTTFPNTVVRTTNLRWTSSNQCL